MDRFWSIRLFRIFRIQLEVHITFPLLLLYVGWMGWQEPGGWSGVISMLALVGALFVCVVLHELGHSLTARRYGVEVPRILLMPIGGMAQFSRIPRDSREELLIALAGPAVNFVIAALLVIPIWGLGWGPTALPGQSGWDAWGRAILSREFLPNLFALNLVMGLFNLLPLFPMDGGRVLRALLGFRFSYLKATRIAVWAAKPLLILGVAAALLFEPRSYLVAILFAFIYIVGDMEFRSVKQQEAVRGLRVGDLMRRRFSRASPDTTVREAIRQAVADETTYVALIDGPKILGIADEYTLRRLAESGKGNDPLADHLKPPQRILAADWPMEMAYEYLLRHQDECFPVIWLSTLIGVMDPRKMEGNLAWQHLIRDLRDDPFSRPDA